MKPTEDFTLVAYAAAVTAKNMENKNYVITDVIMKTGVSGYNKLVIITEEGEIYPNKTSMKNIRNVFGFSTRKWIGKMIHPGKIVEYSAGNSITWEVTEL